jgi:hypothetical protein
LPGLRRRSCMRFMLTKKTADAGQLQCRCCISGPSTYPALTALLAADGEDRMAAWPVYRTRLAPTPEAGAKRCGPWLTRLVVVARWA